MTGAELDALCARLRNSLGVIHKRDIALAHRAFDGLALPGPNGDDCAAIPDGDGYLLFAIEGLLEEFVARDPWFAGYCGVMVNLSDVAAMGGTPTAVVDALWASSDERAIEILSGMRAAANAYGVPIVGGHTNARATGERLAVAVLGRSRRLLTSFDASPGDDVLVAIDLRGAYMEPAPYWNCSTNAPPERLRADLAVLASIANEGIAHAAKDISMGGVLGTLAMLLEASGVGASIDLARLPRPRDVALERWLGTFPSYGYVLCAPTRSSHLVLERFASRDIACARVGTIDDSRRLVVNDAARACFWDVNAEPLTGVIPSRGTTTEVVNA